MHGGKSIILGACLLASLVVGLRPCELQAEEIFITIGSGDPSGVYYPAGLAMATMLNDKRNQYGIRATVEATSGATFNIEAIMAGYLEFGLTQADKQYEAVHGMAEWEKKGPQQQLRSVFSLHHEAVTLVAAVDTGVHAVQDLKGKRVSTGNPGASQHRIVREVLQASGLDPDRDITRQKIMAANAATLLQDNVMDAFFFTVGHPSDTIQRALEGERKARIIPIAGSGIDRLVASKPYYLPAIIPVKRLYPNVVDATDVPTIGVIATLCTSSRVPESVVYALTREIFENLELFRRQHPAFHDLTREGMLKGMSAPVHPGARKYFREVGLLQ